MCAAWAWPGAIATLMLLLTQHLGCRAPAGRGARQERRRGAAAAAGRVQRRAQSWQRQGGGRAATAGGGRREAIACGRRYRKGAEIVSACACRPEALRALLCLDSVPETFPRACQLLNGYSSEWFLASREAGTQQPRGRPKGRGRRGDDVHEAPPNAAAEEARAAAIACDIARLEVHVLNASCHL